MIQQTEFRLSAKRRGCHLVTREIIEKEGFKYCGIIHCWSGDERVAFQFTKEE